MEEILRLIHALQTTDEHQVATPANRKPGDKVIVPPPLTTELAQATGLPLYRVRASAFENWSKPVY